MFKYPQLGLVVTLLMFSCTSSPNWENKEKEFQTKFIMAEDGSTIELPAGHFKFDGSLSLEDKKNVTIKGAGKDKTILSFKGQTEGAEGITVTNAENIILQDFTVQDTKGDGIKTRKVDGIVFRNVRAEWTNGPDASNGSYAFYPVTCQNVLLEGCDAIGASDAGIYVGQSNHVVVRNCTAKYNVAGIEIENCRFADVYNNYSYKNTGGILVFDMPGLTQSGGYVRVFDNVVHNNNTRNFAPEGNIVGTVPPGTGFMIVATSNVDIYNNIVTNNKTMGAGIVNFASSGHTWDDPNFNPYPKAVYIHDNKFDRGWGLPDMSTDIGKLMMFKFPFGPPTIIYDGSIDPKTLDENGKVKEEFRICVQRNEGATFANVDYDNGFKNIDRDIRNYYCELDEIEPANPKIVGQ